MIVFWVGTGMLYGWLVSLLFERRDGTFHVSRDPVGRVETVIIALALLSGLVFAAVAAVDG